MIPSDQIGGVPRVGVEIEVSAWGRPFNRATREWREEQEQLRRIVVERLQTEGFIEPDQYFTDLGVNNFKDRFHDYNCRCHLCNKWELTDIDPFPPQVTLEYDASLPDTGGEFISSPIQASAHGVAQLQRVYDIIRNQAVRDLNVMNRRETPSSPSLHVTASVEKTQKSTDTAHQSRFSQAFSPELYFLASCTGLDRGIKYRNFSQAGRHNAVNVKRVMTPLNIAEVRVWEADYNTEQYFSAAVYATAAFVQVMSNMDLSQKLYGYTLVAGRHNTENFLQFHEESGFELDQVIEVFYDDRLLDVLQHAMINATYVRYHDEAEDYINWMFDETRRFLA